jgi:hypothetical protein
VLGCCWLTDVDGKGCCAADCFTAECWLQEVEAAVLWLGCCCCCCWYGGCWVVADGMGIAVPQPRNAGEAAFLHLEYSSSTTPLTHGPLDVGTNMGKPISAASCTRGAFGCPVAYDSGCVLKLWMRQSACCKCRLLGCQPRLLGCRWCDGGLLGWVVGWLLLVR